MHRIARILLMAGGVALAGIGSGAESPEPAGGHGRPVPRQAPAPVVPYCPPGGSPPTPGYPAAPAPGLPPQGTAPGAPGSPGAPAAPTPAPAAPAPPPAAPGGDSLAQAGSQGTSAGGTSFPALFGDLFGGGFVAGPLAVRVNGAGQVVGNAPVFLDPRTGVRTTLTNVQLARPVDELLAGRPARVPAGTPATTVVAVLPPAGQVFAPEIASQLTRIPLINRGTFKITENDTPRPTTRAYVTYNFYDQLLNTVGSPDAPRLTLHQETFGAEYAFADRQFSVGLRLPYNQFVSTPGFFNETSLGDLTIITKAVLLENRRTGDLLSAGLLITAPTGEVPLANTLTGRSIHPTLLQPYLGFIKTGLGGDAFVQGFSAVVVPTSSSDTTLMTNSLAVGYFAYKNPDGVISSVTPVGEVHVNTPLNHRGANLTGFTAGSAYPDTVTLLGGTYFGVGRQSTVGFAAGAPVTGPRPFSLQTTVTVNYRF